MITPVPVTGPEWQKGLIALQILLIDKRTNLTPLAPALPPGGAQCDGEGLPVRDYGGITVNERVSLINGTPRP